MTVAIYQKRGFDQEPKLITLAPDNQRELVELKVAELNQEAQEANLNTIYFLDSLSPIEIWNLCQERGDSGV